MTATMQENVLRWTSGHSPIIFWSSKVKKIEARSAQQKQILLVAQHCRLFPKVQRYSFLVAKMFFFHLSHLRFHLAGALRSEFHQADVEFDALSPDLAAVRPEDGWDWMEHAEA